MNSKSSLKRITVSCTFVDKWYWFVRFSHFAIKYCFVIVIVAFDSVLPFKHTRTRTLTYSRTQIVDHFVLFSRLGFIWNHRLKWSGTQCLTYKTRRYFNMLGIDSVSKSYEPKSEWSDKSVVQIDSYRNLQMWYVLSRKISWWKMMII